MALKYFMYVRKSSESEDRQMASIPDQITELTKVAARFDLQVVEIITEAKTAKVPGRKRFNEMMMRISKGEAQGILCWKLNRLARNPVDGGQISWWLQQNIIQCIQTYERNYKPTDNVLLMLIEFGMANQYVKDLSTDVKRGTQQKAVRGWFPGRVPIGYAHVNRTQRKPGEPEILTHPVYFNIAKRLWRMMLTGHYSILGIKRIGDRMGMKHSNGNTYSKNAYYKMFANEFYSGFYYWKDETGTIIRFEGKHKPMVSPEEFKDVQNIIHCNSVLRQRTHVFPYRGLIICGECKGHVTAEQKLQTVCTKCRHKFSVITKSNCPKCKTDLSEMNNPKITKRIYYHCTGNKMNCSQGSITEGAIEKTIQEELKGVVIQPEFHEWGINEIRKLSKEKEGEEVKIEIPLKKRQSELLNRINGLIKMRADNEISSDEFENLKKTTMQELTDIRNEMDISQNQEKYLENVITKHFDFALNSFEEFRSGGVFEKKQVVSKLASNLEIKDKKLYVSMDETYKMIKECEVEYIAEKRSFELNKTIGKYSPINCSDYAFPLMCAKLSAIRTCLLSKFYSDNKPLP
jgi:site-specific DNA recombinase